MTDEAFNVLVEDIEKNVIFEVYGNVASKTNESLVIKLFNTESIMLLHCIMISTKHFRGICIKATLNDQK